MEDKRSPPFVAKGVGVQRMDCQSLRLGHHVATYLKKLLNDGGDGSRQRDRSREEGARQQQGVGVQRVDY
jgi:hypothetical protein